MAAIILKPTEKCNSNCIYCDVVQNKLPVTMTEDLLETIYVKIGDFLRDSPDQNLDIIWHGGEPLLAGISFYRRALLLHRQYCAGHEEKINYSIQTNLTLINQEFIDLLKEFGIGMVGTSFDPVPGIRGFGEARDSVTYNEAFFRALALLSKNGIGWGFIYVVHRRSLPRPVELFHQLANLKPNGAFMFNPVLVYGCDIHDIEISPQEYSQFLGAIFKQWWPTRHRYPLVEPFASLVRNYSSEGISLTCVHSGNCATSHLYIGPTGETSQCGRSGDWNLCQYGNIRDVSLADALYDEGRRVFSDRVALLSKTRDCGDCRFWKICHGGCPLDAHAAYGHFNEKTPWCQFLQHFLTEFFEPISGLAMN